MKKTVKAILFSCTFFGLFFVVAGGWMSGFELKTFPAWFLAGSLIGAIAAPEFEPKVFNKPALWQMMFGGLGGLVLAFSLSLSAEGYGALGLCGVILGYVAPYWIKHVDL